MLTDIENKAFLVKKPVGGYEAGREITIPFKNGQPTTSYWRRRVKDAEIDKAIVPLKTKPESEKKKTAKEIK